MSHSWSTDRGSYNTSASSPRELREYAADMHKRATTHEDRERANNYNAEADRWEREIAQRAAERKETIRRKSAGTRAKSLEFDAQYAPTEAEREKARARIAKLREISSGATRSY